MTEVEPPQGQSVETGLAILLRTVMDTVGGAVLERFRETPTHGLYRTLLLYEATTLVCPELRVRTALLRDEFLV